MGSREERRIYREGASGRNARSFSLNLQTQKQTQTTKEMCMGYTDLGCVVPIFYKVSANGDKRLISRRKENMNRTKINGI